MNMSLLCFSKKKNELNMSNVYRSIKYERTQSMKGLHNNLLNTLTFVTTVPFQITGVEFRLTVAGACAVTRMPVAVTLCRPAVFNLCQHQTLFSELSLDSILHVQELFCFVKCLLYKV